MLSRFFFYVGDGVIYIPFHRLICSFKVGNIVLSNSTINIPAITGPNGEPIDTPFACV